MTIHVTTFGFMYGPVEAELVFDVRDLPDPACEENLWPLSGQDRPVQRFVFKHEIAQRMMEKMVHAVESVNPDTVAIGCMGGHHRSVAFAEILKRILEDRGIRVRLNHMDSPELNEERTA